jgi:predicted membrane channel-forming protein YqfA (hemolysin III family)
MNEPPTQLILILLAGIGTALFSGLQVGGEPILVLIVPITVFAAFVYGTDAGIIVGIASGIIAGMLVQAWSGWEIITYSLGAGIVGYLSGTYAKKKDSHAQLLVFIAAGTILVEIFNNIYLGKSLLLRSEEFLGSQAGAGIRLMLNLLIGGILASLWLPEKKAAATPAAAKK